MVYSMGLLFTHGLAEILPSAGWFMGLPTCMSATAARTVVLYFDVILGLLEGQTYFLPSEHISVEILAENLCGFIIDFVLRVDHDAILSPRFIEYFPDNLRVAGVDKD